MTLVAFPVFPLNAAPSLFNIVYKLPLENISHMRLPTSLPLPLSSSELTFINVTVLPPISASPLKLTFYKLSFILISINQLLNATPVLQALLNLTVIPKSILG